MTWQFFLMCYLVLATIVGLFQRRLGQTIPQYNRLVNGFFFLCIHYPLALITASIIGFHVHIGWFNALTLLVMGISFPLTDILAFRASKDVDAGLFGILNNLSPVITIALASLLISEGLTSQQFAGAFIIIFSALLISIKAYNHSSKNTKAGIILALISVTLLGLDTVYESWMLKRIGMGSLLVYGLGLQTFWMAILAWPQRKHIREVINRQYGFQVLVLSVSKSVKGLVFIAALYISKSAAIVGAFTGFLPVMMVLAGFLFLHEKQYLKLKIAAAATGSIGLVVLSLGK
jgi:drug/metabolite transporter (DMT)-like permease